MASTALFTSVCTAQTQETRPWLKGLPLADLSLELPDPRTPDLEHDCTLPEGFDEIAAAKSDGPYSDPRYIGWLEAYYRCDYDGLTKSVEADLRSGKAHPFADAVWAMVKRRQGQLNAGWENGVDASLLAALGPVPELLRLVEEDPATPSSFAYVKSLSAADLEGRPWGQYFARVLRTDVERMQPGDLLAEIVSGPDNFMFWWNVDVGDKRVIDGLKKLAAPGGALADHWFTPIFMETVTDRRWSGYERERLADAWLERFPNDRFALHRKANELNSRNRNEEAAAAGRRSALVAPYYLYSSAAEYFYKVGERDKGDALIALYPADAAERQAVYLRELQDAEYAHEARAVAKRMIDEGSQVRAARRQLVDSYSRAEQYSLKVEQARLAWEGGTPTWDDASDLITALQQDGLALQALEFFDEATARLGQPSWGMVQSALLAAADVKDIERGEALLAMAKAANFQRDQVLREEIKFYNTLEDHVKVVGLSRELLSSFQGFRSDHSTLFEAAYKLQELKGFNEAFALSVESGQNPYEAHYAAIATLRTLGQKERANEIVELAKARFPNDFFPLYFAEAEQGQPGTRGEFDARMEAMISALPRLGKGDGEWAVRNIMDLAQKGFKSRLITREELGTYATYFEQYRPFMDTQRAERSARPFYAALGTPDKAVPVWQEMSRNVRDFGWPVNRLNMGDSKASTEAFTRTWEAMTRNRFDGDMLRDATQVHALYGGSAVFAVCLSEWVDQNYPQAMPRIRGFRDNATTRFGGDDEYFRRTYNNWTSIPASENYVNWYQGTKRKALDGAGFVDFDCKRGVVTTVDRKGSLKVRQEDYRTGKLLLLAEGSAWVRYEYRPQGELTRISSSDGREIVLEYNENNKIERMIDSEEGTLDFVYNAAGKPIKITMGEIGSINVTYDPQGNIQKVESEEGSTMALRVTQAFQNLLSLVKPESSARLLNKPEPKVKELARALSYGERMPGAQDVAEATQAFRMVLENNRTASSTMGDIDLITQSLLGEPLRTAKAADFAAFGSALHALYVAVSPFGLPNERWYGWTDFLRLAEARASEKPIARMLEGIRTNPLSPMVDRTAVNASDLNNPGFWYVDTPASFVPSGMRSGLEYSALAVRSNGDKVAGSSAGLIVQRQGNWRRYAFDAGRNAWKRDDLAEFASDPIIISSFAELPGGRLAIGSNLGLFVLGEDYTKTLDRLGAGAQGLAKGAVTDLFVDGTTLYVASQGGVSRIGFDAQGNMGEAQTLGTMQANTIDAGPDGSVLVAGEAGVWLLDGGQSTAIASLKADDAALSGEDGRILILSRNKLLSTQREGTGWSPAIELTHGASAKLGANAYGLERVEFRGVQSVAALGEDGFAIWQNGYFEHFELPYSDNRPAATAAVLNSEGGIVSGADGALYRFEPGRVTTYGSGSIYASAYDEQNDLTFFADGRRIFVATPQEPGRPPEFSRFDGARATHLDIAPDGALIANDGNTILRYPSGQINPQVLFEANAFCPEENCFSTLEGLLAASDGSVWATSGASAFRWKDGEVTEFSYYKDPVGFPVKTNWLSKVIELPDGGIVISASNQSYQTYEGEKLGGQNLVYRAGQFEKFNGDTLFTSATPIDGGAILGSLRGFYEADEAGITSLAASEDKSYIALRDRKPNLYLGGEAARIGSDTLLFPTPAGIVVYQNGTWFYPERLNWQYPDPSKADIGGRHTYAVEVDKAGRIYAATDQGLVIFQHLGGDAEDFLMENARPDLAFSSFERRKFRRQVATLLDGIEPGSPEFEQLERLMATRKDIEGLRSKGFEDLVMNDGGAGPGAGMKDGARVGPAPGSKLATEIRQKEREYTRLLAELERDDPGLAQLVTIQPLELAALQDKVPSDAVIVQYIPQGERLHIHVVGKGINHVEVVEVDRETLMGAALEANFFLEDYAPVAEKLVNEGDSIFAASDAQEKLPRDSTAGSLKGLYEWLIAPIESQLEGAERVYISAAGALNYVPFAALTRERDGKSEYAVERYNLAMVPTSYLLQLVLNDSASTQPMALVYGNPDGTLPYAEKEAADVQSKVSVAMSEVIMRTGKDATYTTLQEYGQQTKLMHLATHGRLDPGAPERSHLVLGGDRTRLDAVDIMTLSLDDVELVFLSACETGRGGDGLEFATLARAFSHAGVPTTIASLWKVGDQSTLSLVSSFYNSLDGDAVKALSEAQREMIASNGPKSHPSAWAAFQVYGRGFSSAW